MLEETERISFRYCGQDDRASEGYPCKVCGTFICIVCSIRGITMCRECEKTGGQQAPGVSGDTG